jgi:serine/threonine protein kinase
VLGFGKVPRSPYYFLDMELCDLNLASLIFQWKKEMDSTHDASSRLIEIGNIFKDISDGITFMHSKGEIHRDLKPHNGTRKASHS